MKRILRYLVPLVMLSATISSTFAQIDTIVRALVDHATQPRQSPPAQQHHSQQTRQTSPKESTTTHQTKKAPFDGTWLATQSKTNPETQQMISRTFTMIIKDGKATRTLDSTNASSPEKPFYASVNELQRRWSYVSVDYAEQGSSLTIQWAPGQLADWSPKTVPASVVADFGLPGGETAVYKLKGDELTRINDPNGLVYHRAK